SAGCTADGETGIRADAATIRRAALGPLSGISEAWLLTTPLRGPAMPKSHSQTSDPCPKRGLRDRRLPSRLPEKGV
ncbi:hypothetical protein ACFX5C_31455, partial [Pseudomonas aeruginosa]